MSKKIQILIIVLVIVLAYANIFGNGFVIDDQYFIKEWQLTRSWGSVGQLLAGANPESQPGVYRPIRSLLYLVYYHLFGANPFFYHLHSLLVHLFSTIFVYFIIEKLIGNWKLDIGYYNIAPFFGAMLFGLHPVHTESITYIAASMEMTGVVFMLGAFWLYLKVKEKVKRKTEKGNEKHSFYLLPFTFYLSLALALLAFFTYEMTITLPLLLLLYEFTLGTFHPRGERSPHLGGVIRKTVPFLLGAGGFFAVRFALGVGLSRGEYLAYSFFHTQLTMAKMWVKYLSLLVWPVTLSHNHTVVTGFEAFMTPYSDQAAILSQTILDPEILFSITVITIIIVITIIQRKKNPILSFSLGWFFVSMLPVAYIFPQGTAIAEKYLYIASFGFVLVLAWAFYNVYNSYNRYKNYIFLMILMVGLFYGARTAIRNADWSSPRTLWEYEARIHPKSELAFYNLGIIYGEAGEREEAVAAYTKALDLKGQFWEAEHNLKNLQKL